MIIAVVGSEQAAKMLVSLMRTSNKWPKGVSRVDDWKTADSLVARGTAVIVPAREACKHARERKAIMVGVIEDADLSAWDELLTPTTDLNMLWRQVEKMAVKRGWI